MNSSRHNNTTPFIAIIAACLGLLMTGAPAQVQARSAREDVSCSDKTPAAIKSLLNHKAFVSPLVSFLAQAQLAAAHNSFFQLGVARECVEPEAILYQNSAVLVEHNQVLVVTHLPRAALSELLAQRPATN